MKTPKELERLQKIAFNVETKTLEKLVDDGEITESILKTICVTLNEQKCINKLRY